MSYLFKTFLRIGSISWGGHFSLISLVRKRVVVQDRVVSDDFIVESVSLASILPGPTAVNIVTYLGYRLRGWKGAVVSATAVLLPAFISLLILSYFYFRNPHVMACKAFFHGIMPAVASVIFSTGISMVKKSRLDCFQWLLLLATIVLFYYIRGYFTSLGLIMAGMLIGLLLYKKNEATASVIRKNRSMRQLFRMSSICIALFVLVFAISSSILKALEMQFAFISLSQVGGGYVVIPSMEKIFVNSLHWLSHQEFVDGIGLSQITPGPIFIIAGFVGFKMEGVLGCILSTITVYFPSALLMIIVGGLFGKVQDLRWVKAMFKGIHPVVIGMVFSSALQMLAKNGFSLIVVLLFILALFCLMKTKIPSAFILISMGILGFFLF
ncbi:MAG: chromate efflux transporter [Chitinophagaceae bacterium]